MEQAIFLSQLGEIKAQDDTDLGCLWFQPSWRIHLENACCFFLFDSLRRLSPLLERLLNQTSLFYGQGKLLELGLLGCDCGAALLVSGCPPAA